MSVGTKYRVGLVGLGGISKQHLQAIADASAMELAGVCDVAQDRVASASERLGVPGYADMAEMMAAVRPDVVTIATGTSLHAELTIRAAELGVKAIHCEKPMSVHPADARRMVDACRETGTLLTVNHQRRMGDLAQMRAAIEQGIVGELRELYGYCAGDFLSDGTHLLDSLLALAGDPAIDEARAGMDLGERAERFGHAVETGIFAQLEGADKLRFTFGAGSFAKRRAYQEYLILGSKGMLWRSGDRAAPNWFVCDGQAGDRELGLSPELWFNMPLPATAGGAWRAWHSPELVNPGKAVYDGIARSLSKGSPHPLSGERTLQVQNLIGAVYLSGIRRSPVSYEEAKSIERFPLMDDELLTANGISL